MELEKQVVSLELAKRLEELGVKQESLFQWLQFPHTRQGRSDEWELTYDNQPKDNPLWVSAFTVAELGEMLPDATDIGVRTEHVMSSWYCELVSYNDLPRKRLYMESAATEADARAKMLIYLIENGLLTAN